LQVEALKQENVMKRMTVGCILTGLVLAALVQPAGAQDLKERLAAVKQSIAANQQALRSYTWLEKTELSLKGEVKATKVDSCRYGPDGKVQKTPVVQPPPPEKKRGLRGKIVANKTEEMKEELQATVALIQQYVPPDSGLIQVVMNAGTASIGQAGPDLLAFNFPGYAKKGDALTVTFDKSITGLRQIDVNTWLEKPEEPATLRVVMQSMPNGISFPGSIVLSIPASKIDVRITKSNYQKLAM
jgi:hypothetical protein